MAVGYKGNRTINGSWLMDDRALNSLESVANDIFCYLNEIQDKFIAQFEEASVSKYRYNHLKDSTFEPIIEITFSDSSKKKVKSFREIYDLLEIREFLVNRVVITMRCLGTRVELTLSSGDTTSNYFKYEVTGDEELAEYDSYKNIVIGKIENWIDEYKPDLFLTIWYYLAKWSAVGILMFFMIMFLSAGMYSSSKEQYFKNFESEIAEIVEEGISDANRDRAIELILIKQYNYVPQSWTEESSKLGDKIIYACGLGMLFCLFVRIRPKSHFWIGKGKARVKFWKSYRQIVFVGIPTVIIIPILISLFI